MNLSELSDLTMVIDHLKNVINTSGMNRFSNTTLSALNKRLAAFNELFVTEMLNYEDNNRSTSKAIHEAIQEARQKMNKPDSLDDKLKTLKDLPADKRVEVGNSLNNEVMKNDEAMKIKPEKKANKKQGADKEVELETSSDIKEVEKELRTVTPPSVSQPYLEDESLAAMLAAEKQKVAAKKRKI